MTDGPTHGAVTSRGPDDVLECDAVIWSAADDEIPEGFCHDPATHDVLCTDGRWHPRCLRHVPAVVAAQADRVRERA